VSRLTIAALLLGAGGLAVMLAGRQHLMLHLLQLEHYEPSRLRIWVRRRDERVDAWAGVPMAGGALIGAAAAADIGAAAVLIGIAAAAVMAMRGIALFRRPQVKPLAFTPRARRLYAAAIVLGASPLIALAVLAGLGAVSASVVAVVGGIAGTGLYLLAPEVLSVAVALLAPVQAADNARFVRRARRRLQEVDPLVVGITGSYGKTTTKACVAAVLDLLGPSYPTPASFNSYLGVVRAINEGLTSRHRSFVVEMGAYRRGDIAELCELVSPRIGVLTAIGPAHLERFGSIAEIATAKGELAESLPSEGVFITRSDDPRCREVVARTQAEPLLFSVAPHDEAVVWADDIRIEAGRTRFSLCLRTPDGNASHEVRTKLLGTHNVANLVAAAAVGHSAGLELGQIARALARVTPPEHRLSPIVNERAGIVVIDDAYNANPQGARAALEVLRAHPAERRLLVTPGMVELGSDERAENRRFGGLAAEACDIVVLVGAEQTRPIREGLEEAGFPADSIHTVRDSRHAEQLLAELSRRGDVILFENDLPDLYQRDVRRSGQPDVAAASA